MNVVVDVEADGPCPGLYSMVCFGAVCVEDFSKTFYGQTRPIQGTDYISDALKVSGFTREEHREFPYINNTMEDFYEWLIGLSAKRIYFWSDNPAFDWQFINYYFYYCEMKNPFGYSARRIGDLYAGLTGKIFDATSWKKLRKTKHDHNPVNDAMGNAEVLYELLYNPKKFKT
jgi:hypothetical protein